MKSPGTNERERIALEKRLKAEGCTSPRTMATVIEASLTGARRDWFTIDNDADLILELIQRWRKNRPDWFRDAAA